MNDVKASYLCRGDRKNTYIAFFLFLGTAALAFFALALELTTPIIGQAIVFISLIVAAYIFVRYIATAYRYEVVAEEDGDYLLVIRVQGKKEFTQRKLPLSALTALLEVQSNAATKTPHPKLPVVNYSSHLLADSYTLLCFEGEDPTILRVNADEAFTALLASYITVDAKTPDGSETASEENENE